MEQVTHGEEMHVPKGATIFEQGDPGQEMYLVADGRVRLTIGSGEHRKQIALLGPGEFFGELSLLADAPRNATAEAAEDTVLLAIGRSVFALMMQDDLDVVFRMMHMQGERLRHTNLPIEDLTQRLARIRIGLRGIQHATAALGTFPVSLSLDQLARELGLSVATVTAAVEIFVRQGAGAIAAGAWTMPGAEALQRLVDALRAETDL